jgi:hypothetical protein
MKLYFTFIFADIEKVIKGWDIGIATMYQGEIARFIISPEYAYGSQGFAPKVEPDETLDFEIELIRFGVSKMPVHILQYVDILQYYIFCMTLYDKRNHCLVFLPNKNLKKQENNNMKKIKKSWKKIHHQLLVCSTVIAILVLKV